MLSSVDILIISRGHYIPTSSGGGSVRLAEKVHDFCGEDDCWNKTVQEADEECYVSVEYEIEAVILPWSGA